MLKAGLFDNKRYESAVEIDKNYLKLSQAEISNKGIVISRLIVEPVSGLTDNEIARLLADIIRENSIQAEYLRVIIPREKTMVRYLRLPANTPQEIDDMVSFEITKQIPYSEEEVVSDYKITGVNNEGYSDVMLVVAHKDEITRIKGILTSAGIRPNRIGLSSEEILNWLKVSVEPRGLKQKNICLVDINSDNTEVVIISDENIAFSRVASVGAGSISGDKSIGSDTGRRLVDEIKRTIDMYTKESKRESFSISEFLVTGAASAIEGFTNILKERVEPPCRFINSLSAFSVKDGALSDKGVPPDTSVCAVCARPLTPGGINLIPKSLKKRQRFQAKIKQLIVIAISAIVTLIFIFGILWFKLYQKEQLLAQLRDMLKQAELTTGTTGEKLKKIKVLREQASEGASSLDAIYHLYRLMPANISLVDFDYDDGSKTLRFRGKAIMVSDVFKLTTTLEASDKFSNVQTRSVSKRRTQRGETVDFQISCNFTAKGAGE